jgi:hypothetical protein
MIKKINWPPKYQGELPNPFIANTGDRYLRVTLNSESFANATRYELASIKALYELSNLPDLDVADTGKTDLPQIVIGKFDLKTAYYPVVLENASSVIRTGIQDNNQWLKVSEQLIEGIGTPISNAKRLFDQIILTRGHIALRRDLFVTLSPVLLKLRERDIFSAINILTPTEAIKIVGLYLRFRENYVIHAWNNGKDSLDEFLFYWVLTRHRLPRMWKYFGACVYAGQIRKDNITELSGSILTRCSRAIVARDNIGFQFYDYQGNDSTDKIMYHFDYLTLLLSGAIDAQARVAHRVYGIKKPTNDIQAFAIKILLKHLIARAQRIY